jgi:hypothetical protein
MANSRLQTRVTASPNKRLSSSWLYAAVVDDLLAVVVVVVVVVAIVVHRH